MQLSVTLGHMRRAMEIIFLKSGGGRGRKEEKKKNHGWFPATWESLGFLLSPWGKRTTKASLLSTLVNKPNLILLGLSASLIIVLTASTDNVNPPFKCGVYLLKSSSFSRAASPFFPHLLPWFG